MARQLKTWIINCKCEAPHWTTQEKIKRMADNFDYPYIREDDKDNDDDDAYTIHFLHKRNATTIEVACDISYGHVIIKFLDV